MGAFIAGLLGGIGQSMQRQREQKTLMDLQRQRQMSEMLMDMSNDPNITPEQANEARARGLGLMTGQMKMKPGELEQWATDWYGKNKQVRAQAQAEAEEAQRQKALQAMATMPPPTMENLQAAAVPPPPNIELEPPKPVTQAEIAMDRQSQAEQQRYRTLYATQREENIKRQEEERVGRVQAMERVYGKSWEKKRPPEEVAEILNPGINLPRPVPPPHLGTPKTWIGPDGKEFVGVFNPTTKMVETESGQFPLSTVKEKDKTPSGGLAQQHDQDAYEAYAKKLGTSPDKLTAGQKIEARAWVARQMERPQPPSPASLETEEKKEDVEFLADLLAKGEPIDMKKWTSLRDSMRARILRIAKQKNPKFDPNLPDRQIAMENSRYSDKRGSIGQSLQSFGTFLVHGASALDAADGLKLTQAKLYNKPMNWLRENLKGDPNLAMLEVALEPVKKEYMSFLLGGYALQDVDRKVTDKMLDANSSPAQIAAAIKTFGHTVQARYGEINHRYKKLMNKDIDEPVSEEALAAAERIGSPLKIGSSGYAKETPPPPGQGMVTVQVPGYPAGQIPASQLEAFKKKHPNAKVQ